MDEVGVGGVAIPPDFSAGRLTRTGWSGGRMVTDTIIIPSLIPFRLDSGGTTGESLDLSTGQSGLQ